MSEFGPPETRVVLFTSDWEPRKHPVTGKLTTTLPPLTGRVEIHRLGDLYPFSPIYHTVPRHVAVALGYSIADVMTEFTPRALDTRGLRVTPGSDLALEMSAAIEPMARESLVLDAGLDVLARKVHALYRDVTALAARTVPNDQLHPIHYAAGVLFSDGNTVITRTDKGLEYGCTVDACTKLSTAIQAASAVVLPHGARITPLVLLHVDQFGICHAPHAKARAWFHEYGHDNVVMYIHAKGRDVRSLPWIQYGTESTLWQPDSCASPALPVTYSLPLVRTSIAELCPVAPHIEL
jgi:hypothetical protein